MSSSPGAAPSSKTSIPDYFALLGQFRQPWIDPETLKVAFHRQSSELHPDRVHDRPNPERQAAGERYAELNRAYQTLRDSKERLAHLLELARGVRPVTVQQVSGPAANLFFQVGELCRGADNFLSARSQTTSPLLKARSFAEGLNWTDRLQNLQGELASRRNVLEEELKSMNTAWETASSSPLLLEQLELIYRELSFIARWITQLNERLVRLAE